jgi:hypothetical protein
MEGVTGLFHLVLIVQCVLRGFVHGTHLVWRVICGDIRGDSNRNAAVRLATTEPGAGDRTFQSLEAAAPALTRRYYVEKTHCPGCQCVCIPIAAGDRH